MKKKNIKIGIIVIAFICVFVAICNIYENGQIEKRLEKYNNGHCKTCGKRFIECSHFEKTEGYWYISYYCDTVGCYHSKGWIKVSDLNK